MLTIVAAATRRTTTCFSFVVVPAGLPRHLGDVVEHDCTGRVVCVVTLFSMRYVVVFLLGSMAFLFGVGWECTRVALGGRFVPSMPSLTM